MTVYSVYLNRFNEITFYNSWDKARNALWEEYEETYYEEDSVEQRHGAAMQLAREGSIDEVGEIRTILVH